MKQITVVGAGGVGAETLKTLRNTSHKIRVIDRDFIDSDTLARQTLYTKADLGHLKAEVAAKKLGPKFAGVSEHLNQDNVDALLQGADVVLDCTDNWATRCVINTWALKHEKPWIFTSAIRNETMTTTVIPYKTSCFVCWNPKPQAPRSCRTEGIRKKTTAAAAKTQTTELEALLDGKPRLAGLLQYTDVQNKTCTTKPLSKNPSCPACVKKTFRLPQAKIATLCGNNEYLFQLDGPPDLKAWASLKPEKFGDVAKITWKNGEIIVFPSGRVLIRKLAEKEAKKAVDALQQKITSSLA